MRRLLQWSSRIAAFLLLVPLLLIAIAWIGANTGPGQRLIETLLPRLTGGMARVEGLSGRFPDALRIGALTLSDAKGPYLTAADIRLDWSPMRLIHGQVWIDLLEAGQVNLIRSPEARSGASGGGTVPPVRVALRRLHVARLEIGPTVMGHAVAGQTTPGQTGASQTLALTVEGSADLTAPDAGRVELTLHALDTLREDVPATLGAARGGDRYTIEASFDPGHLRATLEAREGARGLLAGLAGLPDLGGITILGAIDGPMDRLAAKLSLGAGDMRATLEGTANLPGKTADIRVSAAAPAMRPAPGIAWSSIRLEGAMHGPFLTPDVTGVLTVSGLTGAEASVGTARAEIAGKADGEIAVRASLEQMRLPGLPPALLDGGPLTLDARARLDAPDWPVRFTLRHPLLLAEGTGQAGGATPMARLRLTLADLAPFAALGGVELQGGAALDIDVAAPPGTATIAARGGLRVTGGMKPLPALIGEAGTIDLAASMTGRDIRLTRFSMSGASLAASARGGFDGAKLDLDWTLTLPRLAVLAPGLSGSVEMRGQAAGPPEALAVTADLSGDAAARGIRTSRFNVHVSATLPLVTTPPGTPPPGATPPGVIAGRLNAEGRFLDAPVTLALSAGQRPDGGARLAIERAAWKSLSAGGTLDFAPDAFIPTGDLWLTMARLEDLSPLLERPLTGKAALTIAASPASTRLSLTSGQLVIGGMGAEAVEVASAALTATITDPGGHPAVEGVLTLDGVAASGLRGALRLSGNGPVSALGLRLTASLADLAGAPVQAEATGTLDAPERVLTLASTRVTWKRETARLLAPVRVGFAEGITLDRLRLGFRQAELAVAGRAGQTLDVRMELKNLPADAAALLAPEYAADGTIAGEARLTGSMARPEGNIRLKASGLRMRSGPGQGLPPLEMTLEGTLRGDHAQVNGRLAAGSARVTLNGAVPFDAAGRLDARAGGTIDLAMLDPLLTARGRQVRGRVELDMAAGGTPRAPRLTGTARLTGGEARDISLGARVSGIAATLQADGESIRLLQFTGKAGGGTIAASGVLGLNGARPVSLTLRAGNAQLMASDLITAVTDLDLTLTGALNTRLALGGTVRVRQADIRVPERLPASVTVLKTREAGKPFVPPPPPPVAPDIALNLILDAPGQVFIRGRGLDVELGGRVAFGGTAANPSPQGELRLRRGVFTLAGQSLTLTEGTIDFSGAGLTDPSLKLVATNQTAALTTRVTVSGSARNPTITLSSTPEMPREEIMAQLLFNAFVARLSPFQVARIAAALASLSGVSSPIGDPLEGIRSGLGLDQLSVGTGRSGGPVLEAGRYLAPGVHVGVKQGTTGGETQGTVQIDITKGLKLETTVGTGTSPATGGAGGGGASIGMTYQFEY